MTGEILARPLLRSLGKPPTSLGLGNGSSAVGLGVEYGTVMPGVSRVMDMAKVDCSGILELGLSFAGGTGI